MLHILRSLTVRCYVTYVYFLKIFVTLIDIKLKGKNNIRVFNTIRLSRKEKLYSSTCDRETHSFENPAILHSDSLK